MDKLDNILNEIFTQASEGRLDIDGWKYYPVFHTRIEGISNATSEDDFIINIPSYKALKAHLTEYLNVAKPFYIKDKAYYDLLKTSDYVKYLISFLLINIPNKLDIYQYIDLKRDLLLDKTINRFNLNKKIKLGTFDGLDVNCIITKQDAKFEAPYLFRVAFSNKEELFELPAVCFGIRDDTCFLASIKNLHKEKQINPLSKKLDRKFRKLNAGIEDDDIIKNVSPNSVASFILFNSFLKKLKINKVEGYNYTPIRYNGSINTSKHKSYSDEEFSQREERNNLDQYNMTNKFTYLFYRYNYHFKDSEAEYSDNEDKVILNLEQNTSSLDNLANQLDKVIETKEKVR